jgi:hypothetical protein
LRGFGALPPLLFVACALAGSGACTGHIGGGASPGAEEAACATLEPGESPLRRMTRAEYDATVRDLLGDTTRPAQQFAVEEEALGFDNQASSLTVTQLLAEQLMKAAEDVAARATEDLPGLLGCDPVTEGEDACVEAFLPSFGRRAFRRPLASEELTRFSDLYAWGKAEFDFRTGVELVLQTMLQSPHFLYRVELGGSAPVERDVVALGPYELASRLSFLFWGSMPDETLLDAAERGELGTPEELEAQARRLLADPRAREAVARFHVSWLGLSHVEELSKDTSVYPDYDETLRPLWREEAERFLGHVVFEGSGTVEELFTASYSFMNADLAAFYGVANGPSGAAFEQVELGPTERAGLLTLPAVLATYAKQNQSSPVHRGKFVRERLLCQTLQPPPNNIKIEAPEVDPNATTREQFAEHSENPACSGCHVKMDPIGFGLEAYDGVGRYRETEHGLPIDTTGELIDTVDADGPFDGARELAQRLARSSEVRQCVATQWFRFGYGRVEKEADVCNMRKVQETFAASGYDIRELLVALTQTDAFRYRHAIVSGAATPSDETHTITPPPGYLVGVRDE